MPSNRHFRYDEERFDKLSGCADPNSYEALRARVIARYHVLEKGLTMPARKIGFGMSVASDLVDLLKSFENKFGTDDGQIQHAIGVLRTYYELTRPHAESKDSIIVDANLWQKLIQFLDKHPSVGPAKQIHKTRLELYASKDAPFPAFAWSRRTIRNYTEEPIPDERIAAAVDLARSTPSSCNRQYCRVHCISKKDQIQQLLSLQGGNRGFGHLADKILVVTSDLRCALHPQERTDAFVNGGMFLMNLSYSLFHEEIAHCILNWSQTPKRDKELRSILRLEPAETVIAILSCGLAPSEVDIAASPRKPLVDILAFAN